MSNLVGSSNKRDMLDLYNVPKYSQDQYELIIINHRHISINVAVMLMFINKPFFFIQVYLII